MARPREFDEAVVLEAARTLFWERGFAGASTRDLAGAMGLNAASLYNAYGGKRALYGRVLGHYAEEALAWCSAVLAGESSGADALRALFEALAEASLPGHPPRGCLVVNAALDAASEDPELEALVSEVFRRLEALFQTCVRRGQDEGTITREQPADVLASLMFSALIALRVMARAGPDAAQVRRLAAAATAVLEPR